MEALEKVIRQIEKFKVKLINELKLTKSQDGIYYYRLGMRDAYQATQEEISKEIDYLKSKKT